MPPIRLSTGLAAIMLVGCSGAGEERSGEKAEDASATAPTFGPGGDASRPLPPEGEGYRFVGRWAENVETCAEEAWTITRSSLSMPEEVACELTGVEQSPGGYAVDAQCTIEGETEEDHMVFRFAESAQAMLIEGASTLPDTGLVYCGAIEGGG